MIQAAYQVAVGSWGVAPRDFWDMHVVEWWWLYDAKTGYKEQMYEELLELIQ